MIFGPDLIEEA
jgi:hypothetical protein